MVDTSDSKSEAFAVYEFKSRPRYLGLTGNRGHQNGTAATTASCTRL